MKNCARLIELFFMVYILTVVPFMLTGCLVADFLLGKTADGISKEMDLNKDGKVSTEEIKLSKYDINKDGILSTSEMKNALAPNKTTDSVLGLLAVLNIPFAGVATVALKQARQHKKNLYSVVGGIDEVVSLKKDGLTKEDIYSGIKIFSEQMGNFKALGDAVKPIKEEVRAERKRLALKKKG